MRCASVRCASVRCAAVRCASVDVRLTDRTQSVLSCSQAADVSWGSSQLWPFDPFRTETEPAHPASGSWHHAAAESAVRKDEPGPKQEQRPPASEQTVAQATPDHAAAAAHLRASSSEPSPQPASLLFPRSAAVGTDSLGDSEPSRTQTGSDPDSAAAAAESHDCSALVPDLASAKTQPFQFLVGQSRNRHQAADRALLDNALRVLACLCEHAIHHVGLAHPTVHDPLHMLLYSGLFVDYKSQAAVHKAVCDAQPHVPASSAILLNHSVPTGYDDTQMYPRYRTNLLRSHSARHSQRPSLPASRSQAAASMASSPAQPRNSVLRVRRQAVALRTRRSHRVSAPITTHLQRPDYETPRRRISDQAQNPIRIFSTYTQISKIVWK